MPIVWVPGSKLEIFELPWHIPKIVPGLRRSNCGAVGERGGGREGGKREGKGIEGRVSEREGRGDKRNRE